MSDLIERAKAAMAGATPGPWHVQKDSEAGLNIGYFVGGGGFARADMTGPGAAQGPNARLIALAPDLARALIDTTAERDALRERVAGLREYYHAQEHIAETGLLGATQEAFDRLNRARAALQEDTPNG